MNTFKILDIEDWNSQTTSLIVPGVTGIYPGVKEVTFLTPDSGCVVIGNFYSNIKCTILYLTNHIKSFNSKNIATKNTTATLCKSYDCIYNNTIGTLMIIYENGKTPHPVFEGQFKYGEEREVILKSLSLHDELYPKWFLIYKQLCMIIRGEWKDIFLGKILPHYIKMLSI
jgi:hypothetical protein